MEELKQLPPFLRHENHQVRLQACQMLGGVSGTEEQRSIIAAMNFTKPLRDLITDPEVAVAKMAVSVLVNLSDHEGLRNQMVQCGVIGVIMESLKDRKTSHKELLLMLLSNLTLDVEACKKLMQVGKALEGLHLRLLVQWFLQDPLLHKSSSGNNKNNKNDTFELVGHILSNVTQLEEAQCLVLNKERRILPGLLDQLNRDVSETRRLGVFRMIMNCSMESKNQEYLMSPELGLYVRLLLPLIGPNLVENPKVEDDDREGMLPEVLQALLPSARYEKNHQIRRMILDTLMLWLRNKQCRPYLKASKLYIIIRELHVWEKELAEHDDKDHIDDNIEAMVHYLVLDEDDTPKPIDKSKEADWQKKERLDREAKALREKKDREEEEAVRLRTAAEKPRTAEELAKEEAEADEALAGLEFMNVLDGVDDARDTDDEHELDEMD